MGLNGAERKRGVEESLIDIDKDGNSLRQMGGPGLNRDALAITQVRIGDGCSVNCVQCGAYSKEGCVDDLLPRFITRKRIEELLKMEIALDGRGSVEKAEKGSSPEEIQGGTKETLVRFFANRVTTDVNQEPLEGDSFLHFAELVKKLSGGDSRAVCVSHGLLLGRRDEVDQRKRLEEIVRFLDEQDAFILTLDLSRLSGKINEGRNIDSYVETLHALKPALERGTRITVSVQGDNDSESRYYRGKAMDTYVAVRKRLRGQYQWDEREDLDLLKTDSGREWVCRGRGRLLPGVNPNGECPVIPDNPLVKHTLTKTPLMGFLDMISGRIFVHPRERDRTYNDVSRLSRWLSGRTQMLDHRGRGSWEEVVFNREMLNNDLVKEFSPKGRREYHDSKRSKGRKK